MKKLIILSIVLLTSLSATLIGNFSESEKNHELITPTHEDTFEKNLELAKKLKSFNAKDYLKEYEHKKKVNEILNQSLKNN